MTFVVVIFLILESTLSKCHLWLLPFLFCPRWKMVFLGVLSKTRDELEPALEDDEGAERNLNRAEDSVSVLYHISGTFSSDQAHGTLDISMGSQVSRSWKAYLGM
ncbi:hypothetical protein O6H91_03G108200 [Diphasiastrum complanatum]|uniref:Uncharacterized protein n=1 Tax=Diphasiastrum complanatum TaxID=34168 RepID=A0ACC2EA55_DIPCM|nr:hypothetical protein O6H91_03G108200 [Diphasiastrum complanatum]